MKLSRGNSPLQEIGLTGAEVDFILKVFRLQKYICKREMSPPDDTSTRRR